jgi:hypothetical protein
MPRLRTCLVLSAALALLETGCGTTRMTDTARAATEMLLVSQAADNAVAQIDFSPLAGRTVYLDASGVPDAHVVDKGYLVSMIRQQVVAAGGLLQEDKVKAEFVLDVRTGGLGTDRHGMLIGTPAVQLPSVVPGLPTNLPEIALVKKNEQRGVAKVAVFAYSRITGRALWQSGTAEAESRLNDTWVLGAGPYSRGSIRRQAELAGEPLPSLPTVFGGKPASPPPPGPTSEQFFPNDHAPPGLPVIPAGLLGVTGAAAVGDKPVVR